MLIKSDISLFLLMLIVCPAACGHVPVRGAQQLASTAARWRLRPAPSPSEQQDRSRAGGGGGGGGGPGGGLPVPGNTVDVTISSLRAQLLAVFRIHTGTHLFRLQQNPPPKKNKIIFPVP